MTSGHRTKLLKVTQAEIDRALSDPRVIAAIKGKRKIDRAHDVPYYGGITTDGKTVYLDRHNKRYVEVDGKKIDTEETIPVHEVVEHALMTILGFKYTKAHAIATKVEEQKARMLGADSAPTYEKDLDPDIDRDDAEKVTKAPPNLYKQPYIQENDRAALRKLDK